MLIKITLRFSFPEKSRAPPWRPKSLCAQREKEENQLTVGLLTGAASRQKAHSGHHRGARLREGCEDVKEGQ